MYKILCACWMLFFFIPTGASRAGKNDILKEQHIKEVSKKQKNLVVNGDFSEHWSIGWSKRIKDRTNGNLRVERIASSSDANDDLLHIAFQGQNNYGIVDQDVDLPHGLKGLRLEFELKIATHPGQNFGLGGQPIEAFFGVQFTSNTDDNLGTILYSNNYKSPFQDSILVGTPKSRKPTDERCVIKVGDGYHNEIAINLYERFLDCFSGVKPDQVTSISIGAVIKTIQQRDKAEIFIDNVKMYYD